MNTLLRYFILEGQEPVPCEKGLDEWAEWAVKADRHVAQTLIGPLRISTLFLGIDHAMPGDDTPQLFETMIFGDDKDSYQTRCATWAEAEAQHVRAVATAFEWVRRAAAVLPRAATRDG